MAIRKKKSLFDYKKNSVWTENLTIVMQIGLTMAGCIIFCFVVGRWIDSWLETKGIFVTIFIILGVIGGVNTVYRQILEITDPEYKKRWNRQSEKRKKNIPDAL